MRKMPQAASHQHRAIARHPIKADRGHSNNSAKQAAQNVEVRSISAISKNAFMQKIKDSSSTEGGAGREGGSATRAKVHGVC